MSTDILRTFSVPAPLPAPPARAALDATDTAALLLAARRARTRYPGPVGELVADEIVAYIRIGRRFAGKTTIGRVVAELLEPDAAA